MSWTYQDLLNWLKTLDEIELLEILDITPEMLVDRFGDVIEDKMDYLFDKFEEQDEEE